MDPSRRQFTVSTLSLFGGVALFSACAEKLTNDTSDTSDTGGSSDTGGAPDTTDTSDTSVAWATGGTASMSGDYADPFETESTCDMICAMTLGPCYAETIERQDISEGYTGLPVHLSIRVVDTACQPVEGVYVDIWHATIEGLYSGSDTNEMCSEGDADMLANRYFRGMSRTGADGVVHFDTCFPGWYSGRAIHIHFQVRTGTAEGSGEYVTSQLFFEQALIAEIYADHPEYSYRGQPDTPNNSDKVLGNNDASVYTLAAAKQSDGALLAWKTIVIRSSLDEDLCEAPEAG